MSSSRVFERDDRKQALPVAIPRQRLRERDLTAEIIEDRRSHPPLLLCVVQRQGSPEILFLGQFRSRFEANAAANDFMADYLAQQQVQAVREQSGSG